MSVPGEAGELRVLLLAPTRRDAEVTSRLLAATGLETHCCASCADVAEELPRGAGVLLLTEDIVADKSFPLLRQALEEQPAWSDIPIVLLLRRDNASPRLAELQNALTNVTLLERPTSTVTLSSALHAAIRARRRQYASRRQMESLARAEAESRRLQQQLALAVDASQIGTFHCPFPLSRIEWNDRCKAHFWLPPEAEIDLDLFFSILHPDDRERTRAAIDACVEAGVPYDVEYRTVSPSGKFRWIHATGRTYFDGEGKPIRFDGTTQDVTESRVMAAQRQELLDSERAARQEVERVSHLKDEFLATLSHELRTPLNAIFGWTQLLKIGPQDAAVVREAVEVIDRNVRAQTQLIEDLLDVSRIVSGKIRLNIEKIELVRTVQEAVEGVRPAMTARQLRVVFDLPMGADGRTAQIPLQVDPQRLQQILWNLLTNATKFTPPEGTITVRVRRVDFHVEIQVVDTGEGIEPSFLQVMFDRFRQADGSTTRKHGGLGLGLSIVKHLAELHGGTIWAESDGPGKGARFTLLLPDLLYKPEEEEPADEARTAAAAIGPGADLSGLTVIVVEDEADSREFLGRILTERNARVLPAATVDEAWECLRTVQPDVIVSDIGMPDKDGHQFLRELRQSGRTIPAIALTAFARPEDRTRAIEAGFQEHLSKPFTAETLLQCIAALIRPS